MEISGDDLASGNAFAELIGMAVEVQPSLADRATRDLAASQRASAGIAGVHCLHPLSSVSDCNVLIAQWLITSLPRAHHSPAVLQILQSAA